MEGAQVTASCFSSLAGIAAGQRQKSGTGEEKRYTTMKAGT